MTVLFTTYSAKRVFIKTDTVLSLQHCRPPTGTKGESEDEKERKKEKRLRPHPSRANTPRTRQNWSAWFPFRFGLRMQRFVRSVYRRLYEDINNLGGVPNIQSSFFLLGFYCVDFNIWISNEQHIYTNQMKGKNQMYTEKETQTQDDILLLPFFYRLNPAVKKRVLKKLGPGMCGNNF